MNSYMTNINNNIGVWAGTCCMDLDMLYGHRLFASVWICCMDIDMFHGHDMLHGKNEYFAWIWTCCTDMGMWACCMGMDMLGMDVAWTRTCRIGMSMLHQHGHGPVLIIDSTRLLPCLLYNDHWRPPIRLPWVNKNFFIFMLVL
jgi:hypothetical protein